MAATTASQQPRGSSWVPSLPTSFFSLLNPFASDDSSKTAPEGRDSVESDISTESHPSRPALSTTAYVASGPPSPSRSSGSIMFTEPDTRSTSEEGVSRDGSIDGRGRTKKGDRPKTRYSVCHAPRASSTRQKLHRRPRPLLQLHKLSPDARPQPAFDVIPSANFSVHLTRAITKVFKAKHGLCPNDLVVLRAEKYSVEVQDEEQEAKDVIGLICKGRKDDTATAGGKAKICMASGQQWEAYPLTNGGYEFFSTDEHGLGLTVRWVPKRNKDKDTSTKSKDGKRFNFSTISPNSRRHPVVASLSKTSLEINDVYKMPDSSAATPLSTPKQNTSILADALEEEHGSKELRETDDLLRGIITMTGIWVTFKEGWSPLFKYDEKDKDGMQRSMSVHGSPSKSASSPLATPPGSPNIGPLEKRTSIKSVSSGILRRGSLLSRGARSSTISMPEGDERPVSPPRGEGVSGRIGRARGDSNATVLVHRAASNRRKNSQATWRPDLLSSQHQLQETSRENLKETPPLLISTQPEDGVGSLEATPKRRESVARPLQSQTESASGTKTPTLRPGPIAAAPAKVQAAPRKSRSPNKRESTTTTDTSFSAQPVKNGSKFSKGKESLKSTWRKLLCGREA